MHKMYQCDRVKFPYAHNSNLLDKRFTYLTTLVPTVDESWQRNLSSSLCTRWALLAKWTALWKSWRQYWSITGGAQQQHRQIVCRQRLVVAEQLTSVPCTSILAASDTSVIVAGVFMHTAEHRPFIFWSDNTEHENIFDTFCVSSHLAFSFHVLSCQFLQRRLVF